MVKRLRAHTARRGASPRLRGGERGGRKRRSLGLLLMGTVLLTGGYWASQQVIAAHRFPVRQIALYGELRHMDRGALQRLSSRFLGRNFFTLNIAEVQAALAAEVWLEAVAVQRVWPDGLHIGLRERAVVARWGERQLIDRQGRRFRPEALPDDGGWPRLYGPDGQEQTVLLTYQEASQLLGQTGLKIARLEQDLRLAWTLELDNRIHLELGRRDLRERLERFVALYDAILGTQGEAEAIAVVDLRYYDGFAVRWRDSGRDPDHARRRRTALAVN